MDERTLRHIATMEMPPALARMLTRDNIPCMVVVNELRAVLAPLLDEPFDSWEDASGRTHVGCRFCEGYWRKPGDEAHEPNCPVLRRDELLGR